jgi:hypothetical protein
MTNKVPHRTPLEDEMYQMNTFHRQGDDESFVAQAGQKPPLGPGFLPSELEGAETMEEWATTFKHPGEDFTEFYLLDAEGFIMHTKRILGY